VDYSYFWLNWQLKYYSWKRHNAWNRLFDLQGSLEKDRWVWKTKTFLLKLKNIVCFKNDSLRLLVIHWLFWLQSKIILKMRPNLLAEHYHFKKLPYFFFIIQLLRFLFYVHRIIYKSWPCLPMHDLEICFPIQVYFRSDVPLNW